MKTVNENFYLPANNPRQAIREVISRILQGAIDAKAECIVTACATCHLDPER